MNKTENFDIDEIEISKYWEYDEDWCDSNIEEKYDLNKICRHADANFTICYFIYTIGLQVHTNIKWLNKKILDIKKGICDSLDSSQINDLNSNLCRPSSGYWWSNLEDSRVELEMVNIDLSPKKVLEVVNFVLFQLDEGVRIHNLVEKYLVDLEEEKQAKEKEKSNVEYMLSRQEEIELKHVKVKEGVVYILSHPMMPGIYKIGFTSRNPDVRAEELSNQVGLPRPFKVLNYWRSFDPYIVEQRVHKELSDYIQGGEYFAGDPDFFSKVIESFIIQ